MKKYFLEEDNVMLLRKTLSEIREIHDRLESILEDCEVYTNEYREEEKRNVRGEE